MSPVVAIVAPGNMGAAVARRLTENGVEVLTALEGRGAASVARAGAAGMKDVPLAGLTRADVVLSILPPESALGFAERMAVVFVGRRAPRTAGFVRPADRSRQRGCAAAEAEQAVRLARLPAALPSR